MYVVCKFFSILGCISREHANGVGLKGNPNPKGKRGPMGNPNPKGKMRPMGNPNSKGKMRPKISQSKYSLSSSD